MLRYPKLWRARHGSRRRRQLTAGLTDHVWNLSELLNHFSQHIHTMRSVVYLAAVLASTLGLVVMVGSLAWFVIVALDIWAVPAPAFDSVAWKDEIKTEQGCRLEMADWLIDKRFLDGKTRLEVITMLGEPPHTGYFKDWDLVYWLGRERGFISIDSEWLVVRLDPKGWVREYRIVRD